MVGGLVNFQYFESIMDNTVKVSAVFNDSGDSINGKTLDLDYQLSLKRGSL